MKYNLDNPRKRKQFCHKMWCDICKKEIKGAVKVAQHFEKHNKKLGDKK